MRVNLNSDQLDTINKSLLIDILNCKDHRDKAQTEGAKAYWQGVIDDVTAVKYYLSEQRTIVINSAVD